MHRHCCTAVLLGVLSAALASDVTAGTWHHPLYLDGGRWWAKRIAVRIFNDSDTGLAGFPVELSIGPESGQLQLVAQPVESLRVCTEGGTEVLFATYGTDGGRIERGRLPEGGRLVIPAECPRQSATQYYIYFDNPSAGCVPDSLLRRAHLINGDVEFGAEDTPTGWTHDRPDSQDRVSLGTVLRGTGTAWFDNVTFQRLSPEKIRVEVSDAESIRPDVIGTNASWPPSRAGGGTFRAQVNVLNLRDFAQDRVLAAVDLWRLIARTRGRLQIDSLAVTLDGKDVPYRLLGDQLLFDADLPPRSACCYFIYFAGNRAGQLSKTAERADLTDFRANLVQNPGFEHGVETPDAWTNSGNDPSLGVAFDLDSPGRTGQGSQCAKMHVSAGLPEAWRGWHQNVAVRPGTTYLLSAWLRCQDVLQGEVRVHAHRRRADGSLSMYQPMTNIGPPITNSTDWDGGIRPRQSLASVPLRAIHPTNRRTVPSCGLSTCKSTRKCCGCSGII